MVVAPVPRMAPAPAAAPAPSAAPAKTEAARMPSGGPPARIDHPIGVGGNSPSAAGPIPSPSAGNISNETPMRMMAQVRDGVAMFGSGAIRLVELPVIGSNALPVLAQISAARPQSQAGIAARILNLEHGITPA